MILERAGAAGKIGREDMVAAKGRSLADLALGSTAEWKRAVHKARSDAVTAVRVRHILVQTQQLADTLRSELRDGARFDELAPAVSSCAATRDKGGEVGWSGLNDEHLDPILPPPIRSVAMSVKPGDVTVAESILGWHVLQVVDVFQTLMIDSNPRTRALPGSGVLPQPLIQLLRSSRHDDRGLKQLLAGGETAASQGVGQLMTNSGKTGRATTMKYSMDSMGCARGWAYFGAPLPGPIRVPTETRTGAYFGRAGGAHRRLFRARTGLSSMPISGSASVPTLVSLGACLCPFFGGKPRDATSSLAGRDPASLFLARAVHPRPVSARFYSWHGPSAGAS
eukprot:scaffold28841_cov101-Isochrysis_galbana.AAC.1